MVVRSSRTAWSTSSQTVRVTSQGEQDALGRSVSSVEEEEAIYLAHVIGRAKNQSMWSIRRGGVSSYNYAAI